MNRAPIYISLTFGLLAPFAASAGLDPNIQTEPLDPSTITTPVPPGKYHSTHQQFDCTQIDDADKMCELAQHLSSILAYDFVELHKDYGSPEANKIKHTKTLYSFLGLLSFELHRIYGTKSPGLIYDNPDANFSAVFDVDVNNANATYITINGLNNFTDSPHALSDFILAAMVSSTKLREQTIQKKAWALSDYLQGFFENALRKAGIDPKADFPDSGGDMGPSGPIPKPR